MTRVLTFDIETSPLKVYTFGIHKVEIGINQIIEPTRMLSFAAKWHGSSKVMFASEFHDGADVMVNKLHDLLEEADVVVTWNGDSFDRKHANREDILHGLSVQKPYVSVDLLKTARRALYLPSYKLDYVAQYLGVGAKTSHTGFQLWRDCLDGDPKAWALMRKYNKQDVVITEGVFDRLKPYIQGVHFSLLGSGDTLYSCPQCQSTDLQRRGLYYTPLSSYPRYRCNSCGKWSRDKRAEVTAELRGI